MKYRLLVIGKIKNNHDFNLAQSVEKHSISTYFVLVTGSMVILFVKQKILKISKMICHLFRINKSFSDTIIITGELIKKQDQVLDQIE